MFCRVAGEIAIPRKAIVDLGFASVNNGFSRGGNFTCYPTKHCNIFFVILNVLRMNRSSQ
jgi:hypothetical protein